MSTSSSTNPSYHRVNGATTRPNQKFTIEDDEEEIDLHNVEFGETSRHGLTTNDIARNGTQSPQSLFDLCTGLSLFGVWSTLTFGWMDPLLRAGSQNPLEMKDLPPLLPPDQAEVVYQRFRAAWAKQLDEVETPSLVAALAQGFGAPFAFAGCIKLVHDSSLFLGPLLLNRLIRFLADGDQPLAYGLGLVACLFLISLCQSLCLRQYFWLCFRTGMNLRAAVVTSVYAKTMVISGDALSRRTTGEISNLMSVDAGRLQELTPYLHAVWYSVFQIVLAMYCLWQQMGVSCLAGITVIVCMIPISNRVSFYMKSLQKKISKTRDERVKITNEVLAGMKVLKLQAWERQFQQRILRVREQELTILRGYSRAQCFATALYTAIPLLVALTTFGTYISLGNTLDIATALTSLALFELLRFPLFMLPQVVNNVVEALVSVERISSYLTAAEMTPVPPLTSEALAQCGGCGVELTDATFVYDTALTRAMLPPQLQNCGDASDGGFLEAAAPRFASNTQRLWRWLQQTLWRGLSTLNFSTPATARGDISRSPSFSSLPTATAATASATAGATRPPAAAASAAAPEQKPLTAAEKTLLVQMAMFQDAEERLARLERDLQAALGEVRIVVRDAATGATSNANASGSGSGSGSGTTGRRLLPLRQVTLTVGRGELVAIVGAVGSGKTSLLQALLGQLQQVSPRGAVRLSGRIAYCAQLPFIRNATLRDNVIFGRLVNERCYQQTLAMTALLPDLAVLPAGDATEIGERGINLSGGQKARVALARAVYGRTDVLLLDDVLAAVDAHVGRHLFEHCLLPLARERHVLVLWATNALQFTRHCDRVVVLSQGAVVQQGTYDALLAGGGSQAPQVPQGPQGPQGRQGPLENVFRDMITAMNASGAAASVGGLQSTTVTATGAAAAVDASPEAAVKGPAAAAVDTAPATPATPAPTTAVSTTPAASTAPAAGQLVAAERSATGNVSRQIYVTWAQAAGGVSVLGFILLFFVFGELLTILSSYWLSLWSQHNSTLTGADDVPDASGYYLGIYGTINVCVVAAAFWREYYLRLKGLDAARDLFDKVLTHVLYAPMAFFDTTPLGRVTNRLSKDVYTVDEQIPGTIRGYLVTTMRVTITLLYVSSITPLFLVFLLPLGIFYYVAQRYYITTSRELTRLESSSRSPIYALFSETLDGLVTLRAYRDERCSVQRNYRQLDDNVKAYFCNFSANCWLAVRLEFVGTLIVMGAALFAVLARTSYLSSTSPIEDDEATHKHLELFAGLAGLSMSLAMSITQSLNWTVRMASDLESQMVAVERLEEYATMSQEKAHYRVNDPVIGGADGSGNSPLHASASVWPTAGKINFFNVSLRYRPSLPLVLKNVSFVVPAGHKVGVVGRTGAGKSSLLVALLRLVDPLDAGHIYLDDVDIGQLGLHVLRASVAVIPQDPVLFSGSRQLLCIARALVGRSRVILMDEATAAVDVETDALIQQTIRQECRNATVLTIAHRLNTILDSDKVLVLEQGEVAEYDAPSALLAKGAEQSLFAQLVQHWEETEQH
eukprot:gene11634-8288_t